MTPPLIKPEAPGFEDMDADIDGSFGIETAIDRLTRKKGQHRGKDGKFESLTHMGDDFEMDNFVGGPYGNETA